MDVVYERCCGLDVHKQTVVACVLLPGRGQPAKEIRTFGTMTADLLELETGYQRRASHMSPSRALGVYWHPVWNLLEGQFELLLVNAQHIKQVPGRKTDVRDCEWIANCSGTGCCEPASCQSAPARVARTDTVSDDADSRTGSREQPHPEDAGRRQHQARRRRQRHPGRVGAANAGSADRRNDRPGECWRILPGQLRDKLPQLERALTGRFGAHHRFLLAQQFVHLDGLDELIESLGREIAERLARSNTWWSVWTRFLGRSAGELQRSSLAEIGTDLEPLPDPQTPGLVGRLVPRQQ